MKAGVTAIFLDKDGTVLADEPYNVDLNRMRLARTAPAALRRLDSLDCPLIVVSNQPGVALGRFPSDALKPVEQRLSEMFARCGARLAGFYYCPHHPDGGIPELSIDCLCRKPLPGLLHQAAREHGVDLTRSWMVGDILDDVEAGRRAGCRTVMVDCGNETQWSTTSETRYLRRAHFRASDLEGAAHVICAQMHLRTGVSVHGSQV